MLRTLLHEPGWARPLAVASLAACAIGMTAAGLHGQQRFDLFVAAVDDSTQLPATDLRADEIFVTENGRRGRVLRLERYSLPVKITILVDNGTSVPNESRPRPILETRFGGSGDVPFEDVATMGGSLMHYRTGLRALLEALPGDAEVGVIAMSPNPRWLARPTTNRVQLLKSVQLLTLEPFPARFSEALVEYAERLERDVEGDRFEPADPFVPVLIMLGSTGQDGSQPRQRELQDMLETMVRRGVRTYFSMLSEHYGGLALNTGSQVLLAKAIQELTNGTYESLATSSRVTTLLPEWGRQIGVTHRVGTSQYRVSIERPAGASGPITQLSMFIDREGYQGVVTADGRIP